MTTYNPAPFAESAPLAPVQLYVDANPQGEVDSVIPVRWCVTPGLKDVIKELQITDAAVLIVQRRGTRLLTRKVVPLTNEMTYIRFEHPGETELITIVVYGDPQRLEAVGRDGQYLHGIGYAHTGKLFSPEEWNSRSGETNTFPGRLVGGDVVSVIVPKEAFGRASDSWPTTRLFGGNHALYPWRDKARDPCHLRKRAILGFFVFPVSLLILTVLLIGSVIVNTITLLVLGFLGFRGLNLDGYRHPFRDSAAAPFVGVSDKSWSSIWFHRKGDEENPFPSYNLRKPIWWFLSPPGLLVFGTLSLIGFRIFHLGPGGLGSIFLGILAAAGVITLCYFAALLGTSWWMRGYDRRKEKERKEQEERSLQYAQEISALSCNGYLNPDVKALNWRKRTVKLRFQQAKAKVCKPYAKN